MGENSKIEWCDHTFNPWIGCQHVSPGCDHCYAEAMMESLKAWVPLTYDAFTDYRMGGVHLGSVHPCRLIFAQAHKQAVKILGRGKRQVGAEPYF